MVESGPAMMYEHTCLKDNWCSYSLQAFKKVSHKSEKLPGLTDYSDDQLFFIGFSQVNETFMKCQKLICLSCM